MVVEFSCIGEFGLFYISYLVVALALYAQEYIVLVGVLVGVSLLEYVAFVVQAHGVNGEFVGVFFFLLE